MAACKGVNMAKDHTSRLEARLPASVYAICADAIDAAATAFYRKHQFQPLHSRPQTLFLPMKTAQALVDGSAPAPRAGG